MTGSSLRWNRDEKFQTRATRTIIATQKTRLFTVVFNTASRRYWRLRVKTTTVVVRGVTLKGAAKTSPATHTMLAHFVSDNGHPVAFVARHFAVDEHVLHFLPSGRS